jgi:hypothetical protein
MNSCRFAELPGLTEAAGMAAPTASLPQPQQRGKLPVFLVSMAACQTVEGWWVGIAS